MIGRWSWDNTTSKFSIDPLARQIFGYPPEFELEDYDELVDRTKPPRIIDLVWEPLFAGWEPTTKPFVKSFQITPFDRYEHIWIRSTITFEPSGNPAPSVIPIDDGWGTFHGTVEVLEVDPNKLCDLRGNLAANFNFRGPQEV
ncbi:hypothetical protein X760_31310 [Mesorhizobium sp. LSHC422A00]|uniref:hypothetical protein n=1 Tax=unclassified Mesorhizobium TaxID=325217 RepID=UPI0003CE1C8F|nr:hypothetical protein [Mesorhizobium sp. LSHC422A00]ESX51843.1 hypothetical protein X760_31310 [Mesorhizobium sp. LSHC422A00]